MAHGFNSELLVDLCIAGLAIAKVERMIAGGRTVEVVRLRASTRLRADALWLCGEAVRQSPHRHACDHLAE
jgi:hypothetical protein